MNNIWQKRTGVFCSRFAVRSARTVTRIKRTLRTAKRLQKSRLQESSGLVRFRQWRRNARIRWLIFLERLYQISGQRPDAIEDSVGDWFGDEITGGEHFHSGVEVIDVVERHRFGRFRADGRTELRFAVMRADQMQ